VIAGVSRMNIEAIEAEANELAISTGVGVRMSPG
jgi:hypothetical protein